MLNAPICNLIRNVNTVGPEATIGRAAEVLRSSGLVELPVISDSKIVGIISENAILEALSVDKPASVAAQSIESILNNQIICINPYMSVGQTAEVLREHNLQVVPVIDELNRYLGVVTRSDVASALCLTMRPPVTAGMATPLGVYLTTGHIRAGAGDVGLFLSGLVMALTSYAAAWIICGGAWAVQHMTNYKLWSILQSASVITPQTEIIRTAMLALVMPIFFLLFRMLPLTGYHAAEHQVVHAMERGEVLKPEKVRAMPRVHPRCGTNIMVAVILFMTISELFSSEVAALIAITIIIFAGRTIGGYFQHYVTTRPPTSKQIESGIYAAESLLEKYRKNPAYHVNGWRRIWNTGMLQVMIGMAAAAVIGEVFHLLPPGIL